MLVTITAIRDGRKIIFQIEGRDRQQVFADWKASAMSAGCTRAALGDEPTDPGDDDEMLSLQDGLRDGVVGVADDMFPGTTTFTCPECGVKTTYVTAGLQHAKDVWGEGSPRMLVHRNGCRKLGPHDFVGN